MEELDDSQQKPTVKEKQDVVDSSKDTGMKAIRSAFSFLNPGKLPITEDEDRRSGTPTLWWTNIPIPKAKGQKLAAKEEPIVKEEENVDKKLAAKEEPTIKEEKSDLKDDNPPGLGKFLKLITL